MRNKQNGSTSMHGDSNMNLNGFLEEDIYVEQPLGYIEEDNKGKVYKLKKALYGLKQALRDWNTRIDKYF